MPASWTGGSAGGAPRLPDCERVRLDELVYAGVSLKQFVEVVSASGGIYRPPGGGRVYLTEDYLAAERTSLAYGRDDDAIILAVASPYLPGDP